MRRWKPSKPPGSSGAPKANVKLKHEHAVRFEPAPGARGTEVHLVGGRSTGTMREELRQFKQRLETGEISDV